MPALHRRHFLAASAALLTQPLPAKFKKVPVGLELYSVRGELKKDLMGTVKAVAQMGYEGVEFYSPYLDWPVDQAKEVAKLLQDLNLKCWSTHNSARAFLPENLSKAIELNQIIGSKAIIMASAGKVASLDGWKEVADRLNQATEKLKPLGMRAGFHNHKLEFVPLEGRLPMEVLAERTDKSVILQLDVGTCLDARQDPVAWIRKNRGRIRSIHVKDWSSDPAKGYRVLFGQGDAPWKDIFKAAESVGGIEYYLIEQEGSELSEFESAKRCLDSFRKLRA
ncbi:MAG: sugar phosphate isomerase/epimerase [Bryobacteraceae bacterium]|nr:sugar phosphate isomerase/epimerase [Bryobacteraceae bacterium]MDW8377581.1 sugar phosphate isomerase/epimerase [Bryobacterales bacterium]